MSHIIEHKKNPMTYANENPGPGFGHVLMPGYLKIIFIENYFFTFWNSNILLVIQIDLNYWFMLKDSA